MTKNVREFTKIHALFNDDLVQIRNKSQLRRFSRQIYQSKLKQIRPNALHIVIVFDFIDEFFDFGELRFI